MKLGDNRLTQWEIQQRDKKYKNNDKNIKEESVRNKYTINGMKNITNDINRRLDEAKYQISNLKGKIIENTQLEQWNERNNFKNEENLRDL